MKKLPIKSSATKLERAVRSIVNNHANEYNEDPVGSFITDLRHGGCVSGLVGELVYYSDTGAFFAKYKTEINELVKDALANYGDNTNSLAGLFGDKFDAEDPLCLDSQNQNLLAWFAFEETAFHLYSEAGGEA